MQAIGDTHSSGHLVPILMGLAFALFVETSPFFKLVIFQDLKCRALLGIFTASHHIDMRVEFARQYMNYRAIFINPVPSQDLGKRIFYCKYLMISIFPFCIPTHI